MDFRLSPEEEQFQRAVGAWLDANLPPGWATEQYRSPETPEVRVAFARAWQRRLYEGGWAGLSWPSAFGGRGATVVEQLLFNEEYARRRGPDVVSLSVGLSLVGPTLIRWGTPEQRARFLRPILSGEELWCQGFSEPNAGSDLAGLSTRAEVLGDEFVVSGQKIWTSFAQHAQWCILVVRTNSAAPKHRGLSFLLVDMKTPGITIRPLREITGDLWFNEVFFDEVRVPRANLVGELDRGWEVVLTTLAHERGVSAPHVRLQAETRLLATLAREQERGGVPASRDPRHRQRLAQLAIEGEVLRVTAYRNVTRIQRTGEPGPEGSIMKLVWSELDQRVKEEALELLGPHAILTHESPRVPAKGWWAHEFLWARAATIYAGTSEIQRNIIAQRVLGLPRQAM